MNAALLDSREMLTSITEKEAKCNKEETRVSKNTSLKDALAGALAFTLAHAKNISQGNELRSCKHYTNEGKTLAKHHTQCTT